ncbi:phage terminase large subunit [Marimonas sp. MJW-29]|uniref:Phage terminase large subunit n=1 Tax=Sulfitobacter sediminis TaxID=3234186 RepID=A0ABV3RSD7_9RHOB
MAQLFRPTDREVFGPLLRQDLSSFIQRAALTVNPGMSYLHNWHIDAIAWHLEEVARGGIRRLIITMPPRSLKSVSASIAFPAWLLGKDPRRRIVCVSYAEGLADKFALDCQKVMEAPWYCATFPVTRIAKGRGGRSDFETTRGGGRFSTSVGGTLTGRGGDIIIIDDPHKPDEAQSDAKRAAVIEWYRSTLLSRLDDPVTGPIILIQQRVHEADLAGTLLEMGDWLHLDLPAIAEEPVEISLGWRGTVRRVPGHLLHEARLPRDLLDQRRSELGSYVFAAQYQQRPAPMGGGLVKWDWFKTYSALPDRRSGDRIIQSWDTASKAEEANDWSVCTTWLVRDQMAWLVDVCRARLEFPELRRRIVSESHRFDAKLVLIEEAGSGLQLLQEFARTREVNAKGLRPRDDKATRLMAVSHLIEGGNLSIPEDAPWMAEFRREMMLFPNGKHDDQVDSVSQFLRWLAEPKAVPSIRFL